MKTKAEQLNQTQQGKTKRRLVTVRMSQLAFEALAGEEQKGSTRAPARTEIAIRVYLGDKGAGQPAWPYPGFLRQSETREDVGVELEVEPDLWVQFEAEAEKQSVSAQQLLEHAAFYFAAELDAGRITQRILDDLDAAEPEGDES
jgi:hypothetical protein